MNNISDLPSVLNLKTAFKYQDEIDDLGLKNLECPPVFPAVTNKEAYRWVFSPYSENCFKPPAVKSPIRANNNNLSEEKKCGLFGMSMHKSVESSINAFLLLEKTYKKIREKMGTHIAVGNLTPSHGVCTAEDEFGHFDFYEYQGNDCSVNFAIIKKIPEA